MIPGCVCEKFSKAQAVCTLSHIATFANQQAHQKSPHFLIRHLWCTSGGSVPLTHPPPAMHTYLHATNRHALSHPPSTTRSRFPSSCSLTEYARLAYFLCTVNFPCLRTDPPLVVNYTHSRAPLDLHPPTPPLHTPHSPTDTDPPLVVQPAQVLGRVAVQEAAGRPRRVRGRRRRQLITQAQQELPPLQNGQVKLHFFGRALFN